MSVAGAVPRELRLLPFRGSDAVAAGLLTWARLRSGSWRRLFPDVYVSSDLALDHRLWCEAALIYAGRTAGVPSVGRAAARGAVPGVAVSGLSAAFLMGVDLLPLGGRPPELTMPPSRRLRNPDLIVVRSPLAVSDIVTLSRLPVTAPERTAFDLACSLPFVEAVSAVDALLNRRVVTHAAVRDFAKIAAPRPGSRRAVRAVEVADDGAESPMETRLRLCLVAAGLPRPETQVRVVSRDGVFIGRVDLAYRRQRVGLEYEGDHHRTRATFRQDIARINAMQEAGWIIIRATHDDIRNPATLIRQLRRLLAERTP